MTSDLAIVDQRGGRPPGIRTVCSIPLTDVPVDGDVRPGDLIFCRSEARAISRLIAALDGYWTHVAVATCAGSVVHASAEGVGRATVEDLRHHYGDGMAVASLDLTQDARDGVVAWAGGKAGGELRPPSDYAWDNLGTTFALLLRARHRGSPDLPPMDSQTDDEIDQLESMLMLESLREAHGTCSGFAYRALAEGGGRAPTIVPAPGLALEEGMLRLPDGASAGETLEAVASREGVVGDRLASWARLAEIAVEVFGGSTIGFGDAAVSIEVGVTPADLWCSPDVARRGHLAADDRAAALADVAACDCTRHRRR